MRQIILDTETTGLDPAMGHRIIEVAAVEVINRRITDRHFQRYVNPEREIDEGAKKVHGITELFLSDKPKFLMICDKCNLKVCHSYCQGMGDYVPKNSEWWCHYCLPRPVEFWKNEFLRFNEKLKLKGITPRIKKIHNDIM